MQTRAQRKGTLLFAGGLVLSGIVGIMAAKPPHTMGDIFFFGIPFVLVTVVAGSAYDALGEYKD